VATGNVDLQVHLWMSSRMKLPNTRCIQDIGNGYAGGVGGEHGHNAIAVSATAHEHSCEVRREENPHTSVVVTVVGGIPVSVVLGRDEQGEDAVRKDLVLTVSSRRRFQSGPWRARQRRSGLLCKGELLHTIRPPRINDERVFKGREPELTDDHTSKKQHSHGERWEHSGGQGRGGGRRRGARRRTRPEGPKKAARPRRTATGTVRRHPKPASSVALTLFLDFQASTM
jgi:hypothetical protein